MTMQNITLGIPTYNREEAIKGYLEHIKTNQINDYIKIIIIDNNSDYTIADQEYSSLRNLRYIRNSTNIGAARNFLKIVELCETEYLILSSDEDYIIKDNITKLLGVIEKHNPAFISPQFFQNRVLYRGRTSIASIKPDEFQDAAGAMSGLIFNVPELRKFLEWGRDWLLDPRQQWGQVLILAAFLTTSMRPCIWWNYPINTQRYVYQGGGFLVGVDGILSSLNHFCATLEALYGIKERSLGGEKTTIDQIIFSQRLWLINFIFKGFEKTSFGISWKLRFYWRFLISLVKFEFRLKALRLWRRLLKKIRIKKLFSSN